MQLFLFQVSIQWQWTCQFICKNQQRAFYNTRVFIFTGEMFDQEFAEAGTTWTTHRCWCADSPLAHSRGTLLTSCQPPGPTCTGLCSCLIYELLKPISNLGHLNNLIVPLCAWTCYFNCFGFVVFQGVEIVEYEAQYIIVLRN